MNKSPIAIRRHDTGMTQVQLADRLGVHVVTVKRWEAGRGAPERDKMLALETLLGITASEVLAHVQASQHGQERTSGALGTESAA